MPFLAPLLPALPAILGTVAAGVGIASGAKSLIGGGSTTSKIGTQPFQAFNAPFSSVSTPGINLNLGNAPSLTRTGFNPLGAERGLTSNIQDIQNRLKGVLPQSIASSRAGVQGGLSRSELLRSDIGDFRSEIGDLRRGLTPGFGKLSEERQKSIRDARDEAVGNLRESLSRRRVLGSSFADDAISRTELAFGREAGLAAAETFAQEAELQQRAAMIEGDLLSLDSQTLSQQAQLFAIDLGLNEQEANVFSQEIQASKLILETLQTTINRQLQELGISGNIANGLNAVIASALGASTQAEIESGRARGASIANLGKSAGDLASGISDIIGLFSGGSGGGGGATELFGGAG